MLRICYYAHIGGMVLPNNKEVNTMQLLTKADFPRRFTQVWATAKIEGLQTTHWENEEVMYEQADWPDRTRALKAGLTVLQSAYNLALAKNVLRRERNNRELAMLLKHIKTVQKEVKRAEG